MATTIFTKSYQIVPISTQWTDDISVNSDTSLNSELSQIWYKSIVEENELLLKKYMSFMLWSPCSRSVVSNEGAGGRDRGHQGKENYDVEAYLVWKIEELYTHILLPIWDWGMACQPSLRKNHGQTNLRKNMDNGTIHLELGDDYNAPVVKALCWCFSW